MTHSIIKDRVKGIIRIIKHDLVEQHDLWAASRGLFDELEGMVSPKVLVDLRKATIRVEDWEKKAFAEAHQKIIGPKVRIAALIREHDPQYREYLHFEILFANLGIRVRVFDDERRAESWLQLPVE
jgi:hypothetical protein